MCKVQKYDFAGKRSLIGRFQYYVSIVYKFSTHGRTNKIIYLCLGTLRSSGNSTWRVESTDQQLDLEKLKRQEPILFYDELTLYEDELADNGISNLILKIRCMPSGFFVLLRFYMRVDGVIIRCFDTRYHYEVGNTYILREYIERESPVSLLKPEFQSTSDINSVIAQLKTNVHQLEKLFFKTSI
ncbi:unnamed protein product [Rotaria sp. Silwood1]|nr:unnamed protein product [Rotaria sp. Silwood1]